MFSIPLDKADVYFECLKRGPLYDKAFDGPIPVPIKLVGPRH